MPFTWDVANILAACGVALLPLYLLVMWIKSLQKHLRDRAMLERVADWKARREREQK